MPEQRRLTNDTSITEGDRLLGSDAGARGGSKNFLIRDLATYFSDDLSETNPANYGIVRALQGYRTSIIRDNTTVVQAGSTVPTTVANTAIYVTGPRVISIGNNITTDLFNNALLTSGTRVLFLNNTTGESHSSTIAGFDFTQRTVTFSTDIPNNLQVNGANTGNGANVLLLLGNPSVTILGDLSAQEISGTVATNRFINIRDNGRYRLWVGSESQYQTLLAAGDVQTDVLYFRT